MSATITDILSKWHIARDQLELAADSFLDACATLHQFVDQPPASSKHLGSIEDFVLKINSQMDATAPITAKITESRAILRKVVNTSTTLVRINVLPPEVLSRIFAHTLSGRTAILEPMDCTVHPLVVIPAVCTRWRRLAINTRSLWSHVEVDGGHVVAGDTIQELRRIQMWLERAHGTALHLDLGSLPTSAQIVSLLQPHLARATCLTFQLARGEAFHTILNTFAKCSPGPLTSLVVKRIVTPSALWVNGGFGASEDVGAPLSPWPTKTLHGMAHLELVDLPRKFCPTLDELILMLLNSPGLQTLRLRSVHVAPSQRSDHPRINLPHLKILDLSPKDDPVLRDLVSVLMPGAQELDVRIVAPQPDDHACNAAIQALFQRSRVTQFVAWSLLPNSSSQLAGYLDCLPELQVLILDGSWERHFTSFSALTVEHEGKTQARRPNLQKLAVLGAQIDSHAQHQLKLIVETHHLHELKFGYTTRFISASDGDLDESGMLDWIRQRGQTVVCDINFFGPKDCNMHLQAY